MNYFITSVKPMNEPTFEDSYAFEVLRWITPIILFILAYVINEFFKRRNKRNDLKRIKEYFKALLSSFVKQNNAQIEQNIDCINRLKDYNTNNIKIASNSLKRINDIGFDDLFEVFVLQIKKRIPKNEGYKIFYDINNNIDFIEASIPSLFESNIETISNFSQISKEWNIIFQNIVSYRNKVALESNINVPEGMKDSFADGFINLYDRYIGLPKSIMDNFYNVQHKLIIPLVNHSKLFPIDPRANVLLKFCTTMNLLYESIIDQRYQHRKFLILTTRGIIRANRDLKNLLQKV